MKSLTEIATELVAQLPETFNIYLARHATPDRSRFEIPYHTPPGPDLTPRGRQEAAALGRFMLKAGVRQVFSSPFERTRRTAAAICDLTGVPLELTPDLGERALVEPEASVLERMRQAFEQAAQLSARVGPLAVVTHGSPALILLRALGLPSSTLEHCRVYDNRNLVPMAGAWQITREEGKIIFRIAFVPEGSRIPDCPSVAAPDSLEIGPLLAEAPVQSALEMNAGAVPADVSAQEIPSGETVPHSGASHNGAVHSRTVDSEAIVPPQPAALQAEGSSPAVSAPDVPLEGLP